MDESNEHCLRRTKSDKGINWRCDLEIINHIKLEKRIEEMGKQIQKDYEGKELGNAMKSSVVCGNPVIHELLVRKYLK